MKNTNYKQILKYSTTTTLRYLKSHMHVYILPCCCGPLYHVKLPVSESSESTSVHPGRRSQLRSKFSIPQLHLIEEAIPLRTDSRWQLKLVYLKQLVLRTVLNPTGAQFYLHLNIEKCRTLRQKQLMCGAYMINLSFLPTSTKHVVHPQNLEALPTSQPKKIHEMTLPTSNSHFLNSKQTASRNHPS